MTVTDTGLDLRDLSDDAFNQLVNQDVRGALAGETSELLRHPENVERWHDNLLVLKRSVEAQLAANHAEQAQKQQEFVALGPNGRSLWLNYRAQSMKWRSGAVRFKNGVEDKLAEAKRLRAAERASTHITLLIRERDVALREVHRLRQAILNHKTMVTTTGEDEDTADIDETLWLSVDDGSELG